MRNCVDQDKNKNIFKKLCTTSKYGLTEPNVHTVSNVPKSQKIYQFLCNIKIYRHQVIFVISSPAVNPLSRKFLTLSVKISVGA